MRETQWWVLSLASTAVILVLLAIHFAVMHFSPVFLDQSVHEARGLVEVVTRGRAAAWMVTYVLFLAVALYHGLYGLRNIVLELPLADSWRRPVSLIILVLGLVLFAYGAYVTWWTYATA